MFLVALNTLADGVNTRIASLKVSRRGLITDAPDECDNEAINLRKTTARISWMTSRLLILIDWRQQWVVNNTKRLVRCNFAALTCEIFTWTRLWPSLSARWQQHRYYYIVSSPMSLFYF